MQQLNHSLTKPLSSSRFTLPGQQALINRSIDNSKPIRLDVKPPLHPKQCMKYEGAILGVQAMRKTRDPTKEM